MKPLSVPQKISLTLGCSLMASGLLVGVLVPRDHPDETGTRTIPFVQTR